MHSRSIRTFALAPALVLALACGSSEQADTAVSQSATQAPPPDTTAAALWAHMSAAGYQSNWPLWPGKGRLYAGREPHGMRLTTYVNPAAQRALQAHAGTMPAGAIVVKENYMPDSTLAAITIMFKAPAGYAPATNDWFWVKRLASGQLDTMPNGRPMEGRVPGCQQCHGAQRANDYIFTGSLSGM